MKTNEEVIKLFFKKEYAKNKHLLSIGDKLLSYDTCIAQHIGADGIIINCTHYNYTTDDHIALVKHELAHYQGKGCNIFIKRVPIETTQLREYFKRLYN